MSGLEVSVTRGALDRLLDVVNEAGTAALVFYGEDACVHLKPDASPVCAADRAAHAAIVRSLQAWDPSIPIISEEGTIPCYAERQDWRTFWLVDPLDGTKEFIARNGEFTVNVALIDDGEPVLAAIAAPALRVAYCAGRSLGAWRISGCDVAVPLPLAQPDSRRVRVVESRSHPAPRLDAFIASLGPVERIPLGSSLKFCRLAEGSADVYARFGPTMEWDVAAGDCIIRTARPGLGAVCARYNQPSLCVPEFIVGVPAACARASASGV
jgi:3'(2'), 5'-bisphosphate nucleotidase